MEPTDFDKQLRGNDSQKPTRNKITTDDLSPGIYFISAKTISANYMQKLVIAR